jgi:hypothetical protein
MDNWGVSKWEFLSAFDKADVFFSHNCITGKRKRVRVGGNPTRKFGEGSISNILIVGAK